MTFENQDKNNKVLIIFAKEDCEVFDLTLQIDLKKEKVSIANKGYYSVHLGSFSKLIVEENSILDYQIIEEMYYDDFYDNFKLIMPVDDSFTSVIKNEEYLFDDLKENNGQNLYNSLKRVLNIAYLFHKTKNEEYLATAKYSLEFLLNNWYNGKVNYSGNWWFYEIGVPRCLNEILYLLRCYLDRSTIDKYLNIERFYLPFAKYIFYRRNYPDIYREEATYANLADNIYICTLRAILQNNNIELKELFVLIDVAIKITLDGDGFYPEGSFIQHKNVPYNASYGEVLINSISKILNIFNLLNFDCDFYVEKIENILIDSYLPFLYNRQAVESVRGRATSRVKQDSKYSFNTIINAVKRLYESFPTEKISEFLKIENRTEYQEFAKAFNYMDRYIYRNNDYLVSINLNSAYISNFESINGENTQGDYSSNFTYDIYYNEDSLKKYPEIFYNNYFYRNGSTNTFNFEIPNFVYNNELTSGVELDNMLLVTWKQKTDVKGNFTKIVLPHSIISIGTEIKSRYKYVSTICNFAEKCRIIDNEIISNKKKVIVHNDFNLEEFQECFNPFLGNKNEVDENVEYNVTRAYMKSPKKYHYQLYPLYKNIVDDYSFDNLDNAHIIKYNNYMFISSFAKNIHQYENIIFSGQFSAILKFVDEEIHISIATGKRKKTIINISVEGYVCDYINYENNALKINDELVHSLIFRRGCK